MKNIIVVGPPRIGKTTLSKLVVNQISYFNAINVDVIRESIYKSICINMNKEEKKNYVKNILVFTTFALHKKNGILFVIRLSYLR